MAERAALLARERALSIRRVVDLVRRIRERLGNLTGEQIRRVNRLLADRAEELYRRADRVELGMAAPRLPEALSVATLARRVEQAGQADDPVTRSTCARLTEIAATIDGRSATPKEIRRARRAHVRAGSTGGFGAKMSRAF